MTEAGGRPSWRPGPYRGVVLDVMTLLVNLLLARGAGDWVVALVRDARSEEARGATVGFLLLAMFLLPAAAAVLKRRRTHARLAAESQRAGLESIPLRPGCLFNPIFYVAVSLVLGCGVMAGLAPIVFGNDAMDRGAVFIPLILLVIVASVVQTAVVYSYFTPPPPNARPSRFLDSPVAEWLGDACAYVNTMLFQVLWLAISAVPFEPVTSVLDAVGRLFFISFAAMLVYFPPRMLYLVEELRYPLARVTLLAAAAAMVYRMLVGGS